MLALLATLEDLLGRKPQTPGEQELLTREFLARGGELRDLLDDLRLPDPGDLLPPGPRSRLGIVFHQGEGEARAVVAQVLPQYRADKMGMKVGDVILTLNGAPVLAKNLIPMEVARGGRIAQ